MTSPTSRLTSKVRDSGIRKQPRKGARSCLECRRRKLRCVFGQESLVCYECYARRTKCTGREAIDSNITVDDKPTVKDRLQRVELLIKQILDEQSRQGANSTHSSPVHISLAQNSNDQGAFPIRTNARAPISALLGNAVFSSSEDIEAPGVESPAFSHISTLQDSLTEEEGTRVAGSTTTNFQGHSVTRKRKDEAVTEAFISALPRGEKIQEAFENQQTWWSRIGCTFQGVKVTENGSNLQEFFRDAVSKSYPTAVARVLQMVATVMEEPECERLLLLIDKLIICDDEYMSTMGGLDCAVWQSRLFMDTGQARRAWLSSRRALMFVQLAGLHRTRMDMQQEIIWWTLFQVDRFASLMLGTPCAIPDTQCHISCPKLFKDNPYEDGFNFGVFMTQLSILAGKVIDRVHAVAEPTYESALEIDQEMCQLAEMVPQNYWRWEKCSPHDVEGAASWMKKTTTHCTFHQIKLILHMPYMLSSITHPEYEYSRNACFDAARHIINGFRSFRDPENAFRDKMKEIDFIAFLACITLILGLLGYGRFQVEQEVLDWKLIDSMIEVYKLASDLPFGKIAAQSHKALEQFAQYRLSSTSQDPTKVQRVIIPYFGTITVRRGELQHHDSLLSGVNNSTSSKQVMHAPCTSQFDTSVPQDLGNARITYQGLYQPYPSGSLDYPNILGFEGQANQWAMSVFVDPSDLEQDWTWLTNDTYEHARYS